MVAVVTAVHVHGLRGVAADARRAGRGHPARQWAWEATAFYGGLLVVILALLSPLAYWSARYIWVRLTAGCPARRTWPRCSWCSGRRGSCCGVALSSGGHRPGSGRPPAVDRLPPPTACGVRLAVGTVIAFNVAWCGWHLPPLYDGALRYPVVYAAEVVYLGLGVAFWSAPSAPGRSARCWRRCAGDAAGRHYRRGHVARHGARVEVTASPTPAISGPGCRCALSVVYDQQTGGAVLWVLVLPVYITARPSIRWLNDEGGASVDAAWTGCSSQPSLAVQARREMTRCAAGGWSAWIDRRAADR